MPDALQHTWGTGASGHECLLSGASEQGSQATVSEIAEIDIQRTCKSPAWQTRARASRYA